MPHSGYFTGLNLIPCQCEVYLSCYHMTKSVNSLSRWSLLSSLLSWTLGFSTWDSHTLIIIVPEFACAENACVVRKFVARLPTHPADSWAESWAGTGDSWWRRRVAHWTCKTYSMETHLVKSVTPHTYTLRLHNKLVTSGYISPSPSFPVTIHLLTGQLVVSLWPVQ